MKIKKVLIANRGEIALYVIKAMKMEMTVSSNHEGKIKSTVLSEGAMVNQDDLVLCFEA